MIALSGITWDHPRGIAPLEACARLHAEQTGVTITWHRRSLQAFADQPLSLLARTHDLLVIDYPHLGEAVAEHALAPLDELVPAAVLDEMARVSIGPSFASYRLDDRQWALPLDAAAQVAAYRPDLLPRPPVDWSEVLALAERGVVLMPLKPVDAIDAFMTLTAHLGTPVRMDDGWIDASVAGRALLLLSRLAAHLPRMCFDHDPIACLDLLSDDRGYAYSPLLFGYTNYARPGFRAHRVRFADMPTLDGRPPTGSILGGAGIAVSARSPHREAAAAYAAWLASSPVQAGCYVEHDGQPAHAVAWDNARADRITGGFFSDTRVTMDGAWVRPRDDGFLSFVDAGGECINACLRGALSIERTLATLARAHSEARRAPRDAKRRMT